VSGATVREIVLPERGALARAVAERIMELSPSQREIVWWLDAAAAGTPRRGT